MSAIRKISRIDPFRAVLLICDVQTKFQPLIYRSASVINRCALLNNVANALNIPVIVTEQYPKAFGVTVPEISLTATDTKVFAKRKFSMLTDEASTHLYSLDRRQIILCGVEAHVCVQQTAFDLLELDYDVHVVCDAVSSQRSYDRTVALDRMKGAGTLLTTAESLVFELMKDSEHPQFKTISQVVKTSNLLDNEFASDTTL